MDRIEIKYNLKYEDLYEVYKKNFDKSFLRIQNIIFYIGIFTFGLPYVFNAYAITGSDHYLLSFVLACISFAALYYIQYLNNVVRNAKLTAYKHSIHGKEQKLEASANGVAFYYYNTSRHFVWNEFRHIKEYSRVFMMIAKDGFLIYLPKSSLNEQQLETFRSWTKGIEVKHQEFVDNSEKDSWEYVDSDE